VKIVNWRTPAETGHDFYFELENGTGTGFCERVVREVRGNRSLFGGPNAFEMLVGRDAITREECDAIVEQLREDVDAQRLMTISPDLDRDGVRLADQVFCARRRAVQALHGQDPSHAAWTYCTLPRHISHPHCH
jgi:hypothetical protein